MYGLAVVIVPALLFAVIYVLYRVVRFAVSRGIEDAARRSRSTTPERRSQPEVQGFNH